MFKDKFTDDLIFCCHGNLNLEYYIFFLLFDVLKANVFYFDFAGIPHIVLCY